MYTVASYPYEYLVNESYSLLSRLSQLKPFTMTIPMVKGAAVSREALENIMELLETGKLKLYHSINQFIKKVELADFETEHPARLHTEFAMLKLRYNNILDQLDIFADVLSQRSEHEVGIWLAGLDVLAEDGLSSARNYCDPTAVVVFLERGHGAAIRRAKTRLPGGDLNPVAVIQLPRERMVGSGIASSLIHEVGHQVAEKLDLITSLKRELTSKKCACTSAINVWTYYERWISEIIADYYAVVHLGIGATLGLMGVVTLPEYFQFRFDLNDPHPSPYMRVKLSCAFGKALFPHPQWDRLWKLWTLFYPGKNLSPDRRELLDELEKAVPDLIGLINNHRPISLKGKRLMEIFPLQERQPEKLQCYYRQWRRRAGLMESASPTLVFAVLGQAKSDMLIEPAEESRILTRRLRNWAYQRK